MDMLSFILLLAISFFAAVMGSMVGMAMIILLPVMIFLGVPVHTAVATGRFSMVGLNFGNITRFSRNEKIKPKYVIAFALAGAIGSIAGASFLKNFNEILLKDVIGVFMIIVSILVLFEDFIKSGKPHEKINIKHHLFSAFGGLFVGSYIGIIGGGGATLVIFLLILIYGLSFHDAVANQKAITLPMSLVATIVFIYQGLIDYRLGIPLFIVNVVGGFVGAGLIMKVNTVWLKRILVPVSIALAVKLIFL